jgi:hypothetical protein
MQWKGITFFAASQVVRATPSKAFCIRTVARYRLRTYALQTKYSVRTSLVAAKRSYSETRPINMPRGVKKENLPTKICVVCERPFTWRKKWERVWDDVTTCSKSCNHKRRVANRRFNSVESSFGEGDEEAPNELPTLSGVSLGNGHEDRATGASPPPDEVAEGPIEGLEVDSTDFCDDPTARGKKQRKALKKAIKAERRAQLEGRGDPSAGQKSCDMCCKSVDLLIRCMYEQGQVDWKMVCGKCWNVASGGVADGDSNHPHYRYGGLWKNRRAPTA